MLSEYLLVLFFFFKQKTAYEMRISDWSSDVCSSDLYSVPACGRLNGCARGDVAEYADGFIERRAVLTVEHGMDERGCHLWRNGGCRFGHCQSLGPRRHGLFDRLDRGQRRADQPG